MRRTEQRQGLRMLKLRDVLSRWEAGGLSQLEAAELLGMSERTFRRWSRRFEDEGEDGLMDRRLGRRSGRAVADGEAEAVERLSRARDAGFTAKHFHERLVRHHGFRSGYTWTKTDLQARGLLAKAPRRGAHRRMRPRRPMVGMMLQGRFAARLARRLRSARSHRHARRRDPRDLLGVSGRGGRDGLELSRA